MEEQVMKDGQNEEMPVAEAEKEAAEQAVREKEAQEQAVREKEAQEQNIGEKEAQKRVDREKEAREQEAAQETEGYVSGQEEEGDVKSESINGKETLLQLQALQQAVDELRECFENKLAVDEHKNRLFDEMHRELNQYRNGMTDKILETMALDVIQLTDSVKNYGRVYEQKEPNEDNYRRLLRIVRGIGQDLEDILYRQSIESYKVPGHEVDVRRQKIVQTMATDVAAKNNLVAVRVADGYEMNGKVIRPERIKIFKYEPTKES